MADKYPPRDRRDDRDRKDGRHHPYRKPVHRETEEKKEHKLYVGNLDYRCTEYHVIKYFEPFGKIMREEYVWHTHGPKRGEPRGFAFVEYSKREEAEKARETMNGTMVYGRPMIVRFVDEKVVTQNQDAPAAIGQRVAESSGVAVAGGPSAGSKAAKILAIKNKLRQLEAQTSKSNPR